MFILSFVSRGLEYRLVILVNHTIYENYGLKVFKNIFFWVKFLLIDQKIY